MSKKLQNRTVNKIEAEKYLGKFFAGNLAVYEREITNCGKLIKSVKLSPAEPSFTALRELTESRSKIEARGIECKYVFSTDAPSSSTIENFDNLIQTSPLFWDCNCYDDEQPHKYIHILPSAALEIISPETRHNFDLSDVCASCGMNEEESPNSRINEIFRLDHLTDNALYFLKNAVIINTDFQLFIAEDHF